MNKQGFIYSEVHNIGMKAKEIQELIKDLKSIEVLVDFKPEIAKDRLTKLIERLREEVKKDE